MKRKNKLNFSNRKSRKPKIIAVSLVCAAVIVLCVLTAIAIKTGISRRSQAPVNNTVKTTEKTTAAETALPSDVSITVPTVPAASSEGVANTAENELKSKAKYAGLFDLSNPKVLYAKNINKKISPASLTKLLTACVALQYSDAQSVFTVGSELDLVKKGSSLCLISKGQKLKLYDLICGMLLASGNDASYTIAVNTARIASGNKNMSDKQSVKYFIDLMNAYAEAVGAKNSHFATPDGWDSDKQYSTVYDLYRIASNALAMKEIKEIVGLSEKYALFETGEHITWKNTNRLLIKKDEYYYKGATGVKTGTTGKAGMCLIASAKKNGRELMAIVLGCETDKIRYKTAAKLFDYGFKN